MEQRVSNETQRLVLQAELDAKKTALERNKLGQFATPTVLAREVLRYGLSLLPESKPVRFLDPAIGTGSFFSALLETCGTRPVDCAKGIEIDRHYGEPARALWAGSCLDLELADFTLSTPPSAGFNLVICNPPYVRHHHLDGAQKLRLQAASQRAAGVALSGLAGLYCHFLALSHRWMAVDGVAGWLIPSEFMDVNYGTALKRYLLEEVTLLRVHRFDPNDVQFDDALVSSAVVWIKKAKPPTGHAVEFSYGGTHAAPALSRQVLSSELAKESKWTRFPRQEIRAMSDVPVLSDLFSIKRGIATGGNAFFILSKEKITELGLTMAFFRPILPSPRFVKEDEIAADGEGNPMLENALFLLDCRLPEVEIRDKHPNLWRYLESGKDAVGGGYLCKSRVFWYKQEDRLPTPFVCTYMGRSNTVSGRPFRFLLNHSRAIVANTYLMLYPKPHVAARLEGCPELVRQVWQALNAICMDALTGEGRVYGGGLHKMEPKELARVPAVALVELLGCGAAPGVLI